jgi:hypothetical protein
LSAAVGTDGVGGETGEVFYGCFGGGWHGFGCLCFLLGACIVSFVSRDGRCPWKLLIVLGS